MIRKITVDMNGKKYEASVSTQRKGKLYYFTVNYVGLTDSDGRGYRDDNDPAIEVNSRIVLKGLIQRYPNP